MSDTLDDLLAKMEQSVSQIADLNDRLRSENQELAARLETAEAELSDLREARDTTEGRISGILASLDALDVTDSGPDEDVAPESAPQASETEEQEDNSEAGPGIDVQDAVEDREAVEESEDDDSEHNEGTRDFGGMDNFFRNPAAKSDSEAGAVPDTDDGSRNGMDQSENGQGTN